MSQNIKRYNKILSTITNKGSIVINGTKYVTVLKLSELIKTHDHKLLKSKMTTYKVIYSSPTDILTAQFILSNILGLNPTQKKFVLLSEVI